MPTLLIALLAALDAGADLLALRELEMRRHAVLLAVSRVRADDGINVWQRARDAPGDLPVVYAPTREAHQLINLISVSSDGGSLAPIGSTTTS